MLMCSPVYPTVFFIYFLNVPSLWDIFFSMQLCGALPPFVLLELNLNQYGRRGTRAYLIHLLYLIKLLLAVALS